MKKHSKLARVASLVLALLMAASMTACSSSDSSSSSSASSDSAASTDSTAASGDVTVKKVGTGNSMAPFCYLDEDGELQGYDVAVLKELDERLPQYEFDIQSMDFTALITALDAGQLDMVSHQLVKSEARKEKYIFPEQYYCLSPMSWIVKPDSGIETMEDMAGKTINQSPSSYEYTMIEAWNADHPGQEIIQNAVSNLTTADSYKQIESGQVDAALSYSSTFETVNAELGLDLIATDVVMCEDTYEMFGSDEQQFADDVDAVLKEMLDDGTLSKFSEEYFGEDIFTLYSDKIYFVADK